MAYFLMIVLFAIGLTVDTSASASKVQNVTTVVRVYYEGSGSPASGANIYNHNTNQLLATTDAFGMASVTTPAGITLRVVEPGYGGEVAYIHGFDRMEDDGAMVAWTI
ncbi:MAG TPA: hypothetical protein VK147_03200 [Candidatus Didemnitutus sp.]|nr:hypothetical protein [Candidatus Didemnitutus sp.]